MNVSKAEIADIDELVGLRLAYLREDHGFLSEKDSESIRNALPDYFREHLNNDLFVYVIREDDAIAACAFLLVVEKPMSPAFINGKTGTVLNVYTRPGSRRKGYARSIMDALLEDARAMKLSVIELKSTDDGHALYLSAGFQDDHPKYHLMKWKNPAL